MFQRAIVLLAAASMLVACVARTEMTSFVDPSYRSGQRFSSAAVFASGVALEERQIIEGAVAESFGEHKIRALRGIDLVPPTRQPTDEEWANRIIASGVDTVLFISAGGKDFSKAYIPQTYHPGATYGTAHTFGNMTYFNLQQSPGYTTGGYSISRPLATYSAVLMDVETGRTIWTADATSRGNAFANFSDLGKSVAQETVQTLISDGLF